jgi:hypothetical protein
MEKKKPLRETKRRANKHFGERREKKCERVCVKNLPGGIYRLACLSPVDSSLVII